MVDGRWFVQNETSGAYTSSPVYTIDEYGRFTPAENRFPSAVHGQGFKPLADYCHNLGLKFGIHMMRGIPIDAVSKNLPVKGTSKTAKDIYSTSNLCTWLSEMYTVDYTKQGAQEYYNSLFELYAIWGVDYIKVDDIARPYRIHEIEMVRNAIDNCGRPMVLSLSPGEAPVDSAAHLTAHANMWRTTDDFWDNWSDLKYQFGISAKWYPYISYGSYPGATTLVISLHP